MIYRKYYLNSLWMVYMIHENYDLILMTPRCGMIMLIYIYVLYDDSYEDFYHDFMSFHPRFYGDDYVVMMPL